jgi:ABC-2 type transport system permease protein
MAVEAPRKPETAPVAARRAQIGQASAFRVARVIWLREVLVYARDRTRVFSALMMPILMLIIFGEGLGNSIGTLAPGVNYRQFVFPGMVGMTVLMTSVFSGVSIIWDREFGFLREILVAPISRTAIGAGKVLGGATIAIFQGLVMFVFAPILGVHLSLWVMIQLLPVMALMALTMTSAGIALGSRLRSVESFQMVSNLTIMPSMFLSGIFFPVNNVPVWMEVLVKVNPVTYAVAPIRSIALADQVPAGSSGVAAQVVSVELFGHVLSTMECLGVLAAFGVLILMVAVRSFRVSS